MTSRYRALPLPNLLTIARIVAIPVIVGLIIAGGPVARWLALALYATAAATDYFDGYLARRDKLQSPFGRMLDPIADKLLVGVLLIVFAYDQSFSALDLVPAIVIIMRELFISGLREFLGNLRVVIHVSKLAKYKTTLQLVALGLVFGEPLVPGLTLVSDIALWTAALLTLVTGYEYWRGAVPHLFGANK